MMASDKIIIRDSNEQDKIKIIELFLKVFKEKLSGETFEWQFNEHVYGPAWVTIAELDDEVIGQYCLLKQYLNYKGEKTLGALSQDSMVRQDQQGTGVMSNLTKYTYNRVAVDGAQFIFGFASRNPYPASYTLGVKYLGWNYITNLKRYSIRIGYKKIWKTIGDKIYKQGHQILCKIKSDLEFSSIKKGLRIETTEHLPDQLEYSLKNIRDFEVLAVWKDLDYLRWRYEKHPDNKYLFHILWNKDVAEGLVVTRDCGYNIAICDVLHSKKNVKKASYLLRQVIKYYFTNPAQIIEFYGHDNGFYDAAFEAAGFKTQHYSPIIFCGKIFGKQKFDTHFGLVQNWSIAYGDSDVI